MARIRSIKPEFFRNEELAELPPITRLLFIGLWTQADREGKLEDRPKRLKVELFPYDTLDIDKALGELHKVGLIVRYQVEDQNLIKVVKFNKHQKIDRANEKESELPDPEKGYEKTINSLPIAGEGKGREGKGREGKEFTLPTIEEVKLYFKENGYSQQAGEKAYHYYNTANWKDSKGNKVKNWKQKMQGVWFKDENKETAEVKPVLQFSSRRNDSADKY